MFGTALIEKLCNLIGKLPLECLQYNFMQTALLAILIAAPLTSAAGIQVINYRMAFFADAIAHSAFAGAALGFILLGAAGPLWSMPLLAIIIAFGVMKLKRSSNLSSDSVIGVFFALTVSGGLLLVSKLPNAARLSQTFLFGDILTISATDTLLLALLTAIYFIFILFAGNALQIMALDENLARAHRIKTAWISYLHTALLAMIVIFCVRTIGVLLAGALLTVPAAAARILTSGAGKCFYYAIAIGTFSGVTGLLLSAQDWAGTAAGATIVMTNSLIFLLCWLIQVCCKKQ
jgi:zinc transport system permease protein